MPDNDQSSNPPRTPPKTSRRKFLAGAAAAAAGLWAGKEFLLDTTDAPPVDPTDPNAANGGTVSQPPEIPATGTGEPPVADNPERTEQKTTDPAKTGKVIILAPRGNPSPEAVKDFYNRLSLNSAAWVKRNGGLPCIMFDTRGIHYQSPEMADSEIGTDFIKILDLNDLKDGYAVYLGGPSLTLEGKKYAPLWKVADSNGYSDRHVFANARDAVTNAYAVLKKGEDGALECEKNMDDYKRRWAGVAPNDVPLPVDPKDPNAQRRVLQFFLGPKEAEEYLELSKIPGMRSNVDSTPTRSTADRIGETESDRQTRLRQILDQFFDAQDAEDYLRLAALPDMKSSLNSYPSYTPIELMQVHGRHLKDLLGVMRQRKDHLRNNTMTPELDISLGAGDPERELEITLGATKFIKNNLWAMRAREAQLKAIREGMTTQSVLDDEYNTLERTRIFTITQAKKAALDAMHNNNVRDALAEFEQRVGSKPVDITYEITKLGQSEWNAKFDDRPLNFTLTTYPSKVPIPTLERAPAEKEKGGR